MRDTILPVFLVIATLCTVWGTADADIADPASKPNIVLIMADDVSWEAFSCYGAEDYDTPNIDALATRGVQICPLLFDTDLHAESCRNHDRAIQLP